MQLYWIPVFSACTSLSFGVMVWFCQSRSISRALTFLALFGMGVTILFYQGLNSDWSTYRDFIELCSELRCTYFEIGFDLLTFISSQTIGFTLLKILLFLCFFTSILVIVREGASPYIVVIAVASITIASLPLTLGAIRQALTLPFLLWAAFSLQHQRYRQAFLIVIIAASLHYSAIVVGIWYAIFWYLIVFKFKKENLLKALIKTVGIILITFAIIYVVKGFGLDERVPFLARIGQTGADTDYLTTGSSARDIFILAERILITILALVLLIRKMIFHSTIERVFLLMYIAGTAFFITTFVFDRNIAGRTLAVFRLADVLVIVLVLSNLLLETLRKWSVPVALLITLFFVIGKSYITMASVGFFDDY